MTQVKRQLVFSIFSTTLSEEKKSTIFFTEEILCRLFFFWWGRCHVTLYLWCHVESYVHDCNNKYMRTTAFCFYFELWTYYTPVLLFLLLALKMQLLFWISWFTIGKELYHFMSLRISLRLLFEVSNTKTRAESKTTTIKAPERGC